MNLLYDAVGANFNLESFHRSRELTQESLHLFSQQLRPGTTCREAIKLCNSIMSSLGATKLWHQTFVRFGKNTIFGYEDALELDSVLSDSDIVTVDVGPVFLGHEGDGGTTIVVGSPNSEYLRISQDVKKIFSETERVWRQKKLSGAQLYAFAEQFAADMGWRSIPNYVRGHRVADFPHRIHWQGDLAACETTPTPDRWVLEIQIADPQLRFGAFFEDVLTSLPQVD
jgi:Xaa-Pro aminopeptidase